MTATKRLVVSAFVGACYATLTIVLAPISYGAVQFRISEALTVIPYVMPSTAWGLFVGCFIANLFSPTVTILDIVFGSLATLLAGLVTAQVKSKWIAPLPPVIFNAIIVGAVISYTSAPNAAMIAFPTIALSVGIGELVVCYALGLPLLFALMRINALNSD